MRGRSAGQGVNQIGVPGVLAQEGVPGRELEVGVIEPGGHDAGGEGVCPVGPGRLEGPGGDDESRRTPVRRGGDAVAPRVRAQQHEG